MRPTFTLCAALLLWLLSLGPAWGAPTLEWSRRFDGPVHGTDGSAAVVVDASGNVFVTGTISRAGEKTCFATIKYDADGKAQWLKRSEAGKSAIARGLAPDASGNILVTGESEGEFLTIKYDGDGNELWTRRYRTGAEYNDVARAIAVSSDGSVFVAGDSTPPDGSSDFLIVKYDAEGTVLWNNRYAGLAGKVDQVEAVAVSDLGNASVTGRSQNENGAMELVTVKYDHYGDEFWVDRYAGKVDGFDEGLATIVDADRNVYVVGTSSGENGTDAVILKIGSAGVRDWIERYDGPSHGDDGATSIAPGPLGEIYVAGWSRNAEAGVDLMTLRYDADGRLLWANRRGGGVTGSSRPVAVAVDVFGKVVVTGSVDIGDGAGIGFITLKIDTNGETLWTRRFSTGEESVDGPVGLALDASSNIHVTGSSQRSGALSDYLTVKYGEKPLWEKSTVDRGLVKFPRVAVTSTGTPHLCYIETNAAYEQFLRHVFFDGTTWRKDMVPSSNDVEEFHMVMDSSDRLHVVFMDEDHLRYALFDGTTWTSSMIQRAATGLSLALDADDRPHIVFEDISAGSPFPTVYAKYDGTRWNREIIGVISGEVYPVPGPALAITPSGKAHLLAMDYTDSAKVLWATNESGTWKLSEIGAGYGDALTLDTEGKPHVLYHVYTPSSAVYSRYTGSRWITTDLGSVLHLDMTMTKARLYLDSSGISHVFLWGETALDLLIHAQRTKAGWVYDVVETDAIEGDMAGHGKEMVLGYAQAPDDEDRSVVKFARSRR